MAKIVLQNQASPATPDCGFTAMYVNCITGLPTFKRDDGTECSFVLSCGGSIPGGDMYQCVYDPNCVNADVFAMDNMYQGTCNKYVTGEQITCWDNKANSCDVYNKAEVDCKISQVVGVTLCPVQELPETGELGVIYMVQKEGSCCDNSDEYVWRDDTCTFEFIGTTQVDLSDYAQCCDIPDTSDLAQCCDIPDISNLAQCCDIPTVPTDNCQLCNGCGYTTCEGDMQSPMYDPSKIASDAFSMDNMKQGKKQRWISDTIDDRLCCQSGINTGDETTASIKCKLGISTLSGCNTGDETNSTIKCKLGAASCADDGYLKSCDFANFTNKQDELISGCNIITINGCTILRCGDICIENLGGDMKACVYDPYGCCTDMFNRANHYGCMSYACVTGLGSAATRDIGTTCGNVVVVQNDGKISSDVLPAQDIVDVCVFDSEEAMLAWCDANRGDMAIRTDIARTYVMSGSCPSCIDSWTILPVPSSPVTSVNGCIGDVCLTTDNIDDSNSTKKYVSASEKACWCGKADPYVSGCTIKTINGCSVLGCGDICIPNTITCVNGKTGNVCLTADDISDAGTGHLFVSQCEKNTWNCKISCADAIVDNCQLCNGCGYITSSDISGLAKCCDIPTDNCQLGNTCGYTTCTGTLVASDLDGYTLSCDVLTKTNTTAYNPTADYHPATKKYVDDKGGKTYIAGDGISIPNNTDYSAIQGPCPNGYHIPSGEENTAIIDAMTALGINTSTGACMKTYLKMPYAGYRNQANGNTAAQGTAGRYWSYLRLNANTASILAFQSNTNGNSNANAAYGMSIRPFKNEAVIPDSTWTTLFDGSLIATGAGIFHNATDGIISISADGTTWITIADKNLGATTVYNDGDTLSESNAGGYFQHGNNYMFPFTGSVTTSSTKVDTTGYGPGNYYSSSTFIAVSGDWSSVYNSNLWGGDTGVVISNNIIYNTGVLEVNGCTGYVCLNIPTDNCQLCNSCGYTTCTGTLQSCDIATINGCCLTQGGDICIQGGGGGGDYGWCDYIHSDQSCCICTEHQLIIEGTLTIDGELINDGKIYII